MEVNGWTSPQTLRLYGASPRSARARRTYDCIMEDRRDWGSYIRNTSNLPIFDVRVSFNWVNENSDGSWSPRTAEVPSGGPA